jgi:hypothetical protein
MNTTKSNKVAPTPSLEVGQVVREIVAAMPIVIFATAVITVLKGSGRESAAAPFQHSRAVSG